MCLVTKPDIFMPIERTIIDFEIIWKKINHSITEEEEILLSQWLNENPDHQHYLDNAMQYFHEGSSFSDHKEDTAKAWKTLKNKKLKGNQKNSR